MSNYLIFHNLGLGDHLIANGLIRKYYKENIENTDNTLNIIVKNNFLSNILYLFSDLNKIKFINVNNHFEGLNYYNNFNGTKIKLVFGEDFNNMVINGQKITAEESMYLKMGYNVKDRYDYFKISRNTKRENEIFELYIKNKNYIFIQEDNNRQQYNIKLNDNYENIDIIKSGNLIKYNIFELLKIIENAKELHLLYSSFLMMVDGLNLNFKIKIFCHDTYFNKVGIQNMPEVMIYLKNRNIILV